MVFDRWGMIVLIKANCGQHQPEGFNTPVTLLKVYNTVTKENGFQFAEFLRADKGWSEIERVIKEAKKVELPGEESKESLHKAGKSVSDGSSLKLRENKNNDHK